MIASEEGLDLASYRIALYRMQKHVRRKFSGLEQEQAF